jgi:hypothetical protein
MANKYDHMQIHLLTYVSMHSYIHIYIHVQAFPDFGFQLLWDITYQKKNIQGSTYINKWIIQKFVGNDTFSGQSDAPAIRVELVEFAASRELQSCHMRVSVEGGPFTLHMECGWEACWALSTSDCSSIYLRALLSQDPELLRRKNSSPLLVTLLDSSHPYAANITHGPSSRKFAKILVDAWKL